MAYLSSTLNDCLSRQRYVSSNFSHWMSLAQQCLKIIKGGNVLKTLHVASQNK